jgi:hypothetical protein
VYFSPAALINTLWLINTLHFGMRGGCSEHRQLCWGDFTLCFDSDLSRSSQYIIQKYNVGIKEKRNQFKKRTSIYK